MRVVLLAALILAAPAAAAVPVAEARAILKEAVEIPSVLGRGQNIVLAEKLRARLIAAGYAPGDVVVEAVAGEAILSARYPGTGGAKPIAVIGHMDVVEADPKDWVRDPFKLVEENTASGAYLFGRGVADNKFDVSMIVATLIDMKRAGVKPKRDIILYLSGDEETAGKTAAVQAKAAAAAGVEFVLNGDGGGGGLTTDNKPVAYALQGAEKTYADFEFAFTNPGGHSSAPRPDNAIYRLAAALTRLQAYKFPPQINALTRATMADAGLRVGGTTGAALSKYAADPSDAAAAATLAADPNWVGQVGTTCVATMLSGGHAPNALPQRAAAMVNCRIFPGTSVAEVKSTLLGVIADKDVIATTKVDWPVTSPSPLRSDVTGAVAKAVHARFPGLAVVPGQTSGATDCVFYRALNMPCYGVSGLFMRGEDEFSHGLNERVPVAAIEPALVHWRILLTELSR